MQEIIRGGEEDAIMIAGRSEGWGKGMGVVRGDLPLAATLVVYYLVTWSPFFLVKPDWVR